MSERVTPNGAKRIVITRGVIISVALGNESARGALITTHSIAGSNLSILPARCRMRAAEPIPSQPRLFARCTRAWMEDQPLPGCRKWSIKKWLSLPGDAPADPCRIRATPMGNSRPGGFATKSLAGVSSVPPFVGGFRLPGLGGLTRAAD